MRKIKIYQRISPIHTMSKKKVLFYTGMSSLKEIVNTINFISKSKIYKMQNNKVKLINKKKYSC